MITVLTYLCVALVVAVLILLMSLVTAQSRISALERRIKFIKTERQLDIWSDYVKGDDQWSK